MFRLAQFDASGGGDMNTTNNNNNMLIDNDDTFSNMLLTNSALNFFPPSVSSSTTNPTTTSKSSSSTNTTTHHTSSSNNNSNSGNNNIEIGKYAVWSVSSAKQGNGVEELRDDSLETYWQSDGPQPHSINIQFHKVLTIHEVAIYLDYKKDESYTPQVLSVRCGSSYHDLTLIKTVELEEPVGYVNINMLLSSNTPGGDGGDKKASSMEYCRCNMLQIVISQNHQNGRDTHVRQVKVYGPVVQQHSDHHSMNNNMNGINSLMDLTTTTTTNQSSFDTLQFSMFSVLR